MFGSWQNSHFIFSTIQGTLQKRKKNVTDEQFGVLSDDNVHIVSHELTAVVPTSPHLDKTWPTNVQAWLGEGFIGPLPVLES